jgi:hypothetical protein
MTTAARAPGQEGSVMENRKRADDFAELISLAKAARRAGICVASAVKLAEHNEFPRITSIGRKRVVGRRAFERFLADRNGDAGSLTGPRPPSPRWTKSDKSTIAMDLAAR